MTKLVKIYALSDPRNNQIRYVGKTVMTLKKRLYHHLWDLKRCTNHHKKHWIEKLLESGDAPKILLLDEVDKDGWQFWEKYWISQMKCWGFDLVNYHEGGSGWTSEQIKSLWLTKEYRDFHTQRVQGEKNPFYGKKHSDETKEILRMKCPKYGKEHPFFNKKHSQESILKIRSNQPTLKGVARLNLQGEIIDEWVGIRLMCEELDLDSGAVCRVLKGKNKTHKGFKFKYLRQFQC
jgi:group I intron endonuclease